MNTPQRVLAAMRGIWGTLLSILLAASATAQPNSAAASNAAASKEEAIVISRFEVTTDRF